MNNKWLFLCIQKLRTGLFADSIINAALTI